MNSKRVFLSLCMILVVPEPSLGQRPEADPITLERVPEIHAKEWINPQPARLYRRPKLALVAFWEVADHETKEFLRKLGRIYQADHSDRIQIIALTKDDRNKVERFLRNEKIQFKIGTESGSVRDFKVEEVPAVVLIDLADHQVKFRVTGENVDFDAIRVVIEAILGPLTEKNSSTARTLEEKADHSKYYARVQEGEREVGAITNSILELNHLTDDDLQVLDDYYESNLPSDPDQSSAPSERAARGLAIGSSGESGYGALLRSGKLSQETRRGIERRLLSIAAKDPEQRLDAVSALARFGEVGNQELLDGLGSLHDQENDHFMRGAIKQAIDGLTAGKSEAVKSSQYGEAIPLRNKLRKMQNASDTEWANGYKYSQQVSHAQSRQLIDDYWKNLSSKMTVDRENAMLIRLSGVSELEARASRGTLDDRDFARDSLMDMVELEPDLGIRWSIVGTLKEIGKKAGEAERARILETLKRRLDAEPDEYFVRPRIQQSIDELSSKP